MNNLSIPGLLIAGLSFVVTYLVAQAIARRFKKKKQQRTTHIEQKAQSRQVRRARARQSKRGV